MILNIDRLSFSYNETPLICDLSLSVDAGEVVCLLGPNGAGKTTLLDCVLGFYRPNEGSITIGGKETAAYSRAQLAKQVAYVPQKHAPSFPYSVREVVRMGRTAHAGLLGIPGKEDAAICDAVLRQVGLEDFADRPYTSLSGGELKLVLLARALAQKAPLMILDEPTSSLDFKNEMRFLETLVQLAQREKIGILMATHALQHAFWFESKGLPVKVALLSKGKPARLGTPKDLLTPETLAEVYGVRAAVNETTNDRGEVMRTITLFGSLEEQG